MKAAELRQKDVAGLEVEVKELQKAHFGLRMQKGTQQLNNTSQLRSTRAALHVRKPFLLKSKPLKPRKLKEQT